MANRNHNLAEVLPDQESNLARETRPKPREVKEEMPPEERRRRDQVRKDFETSVGLDRNFFAEVKRHGPELEDTIDLIEDVESLTFGGELDNVRLGDVSLNGVSRRVYDGEPVRVAYVKSAGDETYYRRDERGVNFNVQQSRDPQTGSLLEKIVPTAEVIRAMKLKLEDEQNNIQKYDLIMKSLPTICSRIADAYGITPKDLPIRPDVMSNRISIPIESSPKREYAASRIDELVNFGVVPLTVLRKEAGYTDIQSVQEAVRATDPQIPPRPMTEDDFDELVKEGPRHPGAESFMRVACLDYLIQSLDRHDNNILYDEAGKKFHAIDNAMSFPLQIRIDANDPSKDTIADPMVSYPLEVIDKHPDWKLDAEALEGLKQLHSAIVKYLEERPRLKAEQKQNPFAMQTPEALRAGKEAKYLTSLFRFLFGNERIAAKEAEAFAIRLTHLIKLGRPPELPESVFSRQAKTMFKMQKEASEQNKSTPREALGR